MAELSDSFIAMPGGIGTLEELFEVWTWAQLGYHTKPCALLNVDGFFDGLATFLNSLVEQAFVKPNHREMLIVEEQVESLLAAISNYEAPVVTKWVKASE